METPLTTSNSDTFVSITSPIAGSAVTVGVPLDICVTAMAPTIGSTITQIKFLADNSVIGSVVVAPYTIQWNPVAGNISLTAQVTDSLGGTSTSAPVVITGVI